MNFEIVISSAIVSAIISVLGNIITAKIAQRTAEKTAQQTANREIEKMELTWKREDFVSSDDEFAEMASASARFVHGSSDSAQRDALEKVASVRSKENGEIGRILDDLYAQIRSGNQDAANDSLTKAINEKRSTKGIGL